MKKGIGIIIGVIVLAALIGGYMYLRAPAAEDVNIDNSKYSAYANPEAVISPAELKEMMDNNEDFVLVDFRKGVKYMVEHIEGAVNAWRSEEENPNAAYGGMRATPEQFANFLESKGISNDSTVVIYDSKGEYDAARMWWIMALYGHHLDKIHLLDGGLPAWKGSGYETTKAQPDIEEGNYKMDESKFRMELLATVEDVKANLDNDQAVILDTRSEGEYTGESLKSGAKRKGRIPGAPWIEWSNAISDDKTFKTVKELEKVYKDNGVTSDKTIIPYCQSAVRSAHTTFVLTQLLGYEDVKNYDGSWIEWSSNEDLPLETGK